MEKEKQDTKLRKLAELHDQDTRVIAEQNENLQKLEKEKLEIATSLCSLQSELCDLGLQKKLLSEFANDKSKKIEELNNDLKLQLENTESVRKERDVWRDKLFQSIDSAKQELDITKQLHKKEALQLEARLRAEFDKEKLFFTRDANEKIDGSKALLNQEIEDLKSRNDELLLMFKDEKYRLENKLKQKSSEVVCLSEKMLNIERRFQGEIDSKEKQLQSIESIATELRRENEGLIESSDESLRLAQSQNQDQLSLIRLQAEAQLQMLLESKDSEIDSIKSELESVRASTNLEQSRLLKENELLSCTLKSHDSMKSATQIEFDSLLNKLSDTERQLRDLQAELTQVNLHNSEECQKKKELHEVCERLQNENSAVQKVISSLNQNIDSITNERDRAISTVIELNIKISQIHEEQSVLQNALRQESLNLAHQRSFSSMYESTISDLRSQNQKLSDSVLKLKEVSRQQKEEIKAYADAVEICTSKSRVVIEGLQEKATREKSAIQLSFSEALENNKKLEETVAELRQRIQEDSELHSLKVTNIHSDHKRKMCEIGARNLQEMEAMKEEMREEIENLKNLLKSFRAESEKLKRLLEQQQDNITFKSNQHKEEVKKLLAKHELDLQNECFKNDSLVEEIHQQNGIKLREEQKSNQDLMEKMLCDFEMAKSYLENEIAKRDDEIKDWSIKYSNREARQIDLQKIKTLDDEIDRLNRKIHVLTDEIRQAKSEIINREESLNRVFRSRPVVGYLDPTAKKKHTNIGQKTVTHSVMAVAATTTTQLPLLSGGFSGSQGLGRDSIQTAQKRLSRPSSADHIRGSTTGR